MERAVEDCLRQRRNGERLVERAVEDCLRERRIVRMPGPLAYGRRVVVNLYRVRPQY